MPDAARAGRDYRYLEFCQISLQGAGGEPIFRDGVGIGRVTSGGYGYGVGMSLALGYVKNAEPGDSVEIMVLGRPHRAIILAQPPFDPEGKRLRA